MVDDPRAWIRIYNRLLGQISEGGLEPGQKLPPIDAILRDGDALARQTVTKALKRLETEGHIERIAGLGYYVTRS